jgi:hypothetical protein
MNGLVAVRCGVLTRFERHGWQRMVDHSRALTTSSIAAGSVMGGRQVTP